MFSAIQNAVSLKGGLNGLKLILGAALVVLAHQVAAIHDLMPMYPDAHGLEVVLNYLNEAIAVIQKILALLGNGLLGVGAVHKVAKLFFPGIT